MYFLKKIKNNFVFRNAIWMFTSNVFLYAANFIGAVIVIRYLGLSGYGTLSLSMYAISVVTPLIIQNSERSVIFLIREANYSPGYIIGSLFVPMFGFSFVLCLVGVIGSIALGGEEMLLSVIAAVSILFMPVRVLRPYFLCKGMSGHNFLSDLFLGVGGLLVRLLLVSIHAPVWAFGLAILIPSALAAVSLVVSYIRLSGWVSLEYGGVLAGANFCRSIPIIGASLVGALAVHADKFILSFTSGTAAVGVIAIFTQLVLPVRVAAASLSAARLPQLVGAGHDRDVGRFQRESIKGLSLNISIAILFGAILYFSLPIISMLMASDILTHKDLYILLIVGYVFSIPNQFIIEYCMQFGFEKKYLSTVLCSSSLTIILVSIIVMNYGLFGSALTSFVSSISLSFTFMYLFDVKKEYRKIYFQSLMSGLSFSGLISFFKDK